MAVTLLTTADVTVAYGEADALRVETLVQDVSALARRIAPCLAGDTLTVEVADAARAVLRRAVARHLDQGANTLDPQVMTDAFGRDIRTPVSLLTRGERADLAQLCETVSTTRGRPQYSFPDPVPYPDRVAR